LHVGIENTRTGGPIRRAHVLALSIQIDVKWIEPLQVIHDVFRVFSRRKTWQC
jgi:hypothetical protein